MCVGLRLEGLLNNCTLIQSFNENSLEIDTLQYPHLLLLAEIALLGFPGERMNEKFSILLSCEL